MGSISFFLSYIFVLVSRIRYWMYLVGVIGWFGDGSGFNRFVFWKRRFCSYYSVEGSRVL